MTTGRCGDCVEQDLEPAEDDEHNFAVRLAEGFHLLDLGEDDSEEPVSDGRYRLFNGKTWEEVSEEELETIYGA